MHAAALVLALLLATDLSARFGEPPSRADGSTAAADQQGLAALYPGDVGIESDAAVVLVEKFEDASTAGVFNRWTDILNGAAMSLTNDVPPGSTGTRSLRIPWSGGGVNNGGHLYKLLAQGIDDTLYVRYYVKYPTSGKYVHTGIWAGGYNPALAWPNPQAGVKPAGNDRFAAGAEQAHTSAQFDHYNYWMNMRASSDGNYWGNELLNNPQVTGRQGQWLCVEQMIKLNNPLSASNGEHAIWLDGNKISHLGPGFPNGTWAGGNFNPDTGGAPFEGFRWRSDGNLKINYVWLQNYSPNDPAGFTSEMKFDHVVVAKSYVGCLASATQTAPAAPTNLRIVTGALPVPVATVTVTPATSSIQMAATTQLSATLKDAAGNVLTGRGVAWSSSSLSAATVSATGLVTGVAAGSATITATSEGKSATATVTVSALPSTAWPNKPSGMTVRLDWGMDQAPPTSGDVAIPGSPGVKIVANAAPGDPMGWTQLTSDSTAPLSPSGVYDFVYPQGMIEGDAPSTVYYAGLGARTVYAGFWWKPSSPFDYGPNGNKIAFIFNGGGGAGGQQFLILMPDGRLHVLPEYPGDYRWRTPNVNATVVTLGAWHKIEWYADLSSGTLQWWLDGVLQGSYTDVTNPVNFDMFQFSPTWGGNSGARKRQTDHYWFDHLHLATR